MTRAAIVQGIQMLIEKFLQRAEDWASNRNAGLLAVLQCEPPDDSQQASRLALDSPGTQKLVLLTLCMEAYSSV